MPPEPANPRRTGLLLLLSYPSSPSPPNPNPSTRSIPVSCPCRRPRPLLGALYLRPGSPRFQLGSGFLLGGREMAEKEEAKVEGEEREPETEGDSEEVEVKFRLFDGSDIGPIRCNAAATTVAALKDRVVAEWPKDKSIIPKMANDVKLISGGKILENNKNIAQCRAPFGDLPSSAITMHVVVQPSSAKSKPDKKASKLPKTTHCSCTIL